MVIVQLLLSFSFNADACVCLIKRKSIEMRRRKKSLYIHTVYAWSRVSPEGKKKCCSVRAYSRTDR